MARLRQRTCCSPRCGTHIMIIPSQCTPANTTIDTVHADQQARWWPSRRKHCSHRRTPNVAPPTRSLLLMAEPSNAMPAHGVHAADPGAAERARRHSCLYSRLCTASLAGDTAVVAALTGPERRRRGWRGRVRVHSPAQRRGVATVRGIERWARGGGTFCCLRTTPTQTTGRPARRQRGCTWHRLAVHVPCP